MFNVEYYSVHVLVSGTLLTICTLQIIVNMVFMTKNNVEI